MNAFDLLFPFVLAGLLQALLLGLVIAIAAALWANRLCLARNRFDAWPLFVFLFPPLVLILWALPALPPGKSQDAITARSGVV